MYIFFGIKPTIENGEHMNDLEKVNKDKQKKIVITSVVVTLTIATLLVCVFHTDRVYTHLFYVPIAMSSIWIPKMTMMIGTGFALYHLTIEFVFGMGITASVLSRSIIIVVSSFILNDIWKRELIYQKQIKILTYKSSHDALTKLYNRGYFDMTLEAELKYPVTVFIIDIDGLKHINDCFGHDAGDTQIIATSNVLHQSLRLGDTLARVGGDEFGIIAQSCSEEGAIDILMRVERQLTLYNETVDTARWLSISIGYKVNEGLENIRETMSEADRVMYDIKRRKVEVSHETVKRSV